MTNTILEIGMCLESGKCLDVGEAIQSVNTNLLTEEEGIYHSILTPIKLFIFNKKQLTWSCFLDFLDNKNLRKVQ
jgi:hypothetical protein